MTDETIITPTPVTTVEVASTTERKAFLTAFAKAQGGFLPIEKNRSVTIKPREGAPYHFKFADLQEIQNKTRPALSANGLSTGFLTEHEPEGVWLVLLLSHAEGFERKSITFVKYTPDPKTFGGMLSYMRRYLLQSMLDVSADDDLDENGNNTDPQTGEAPAPARATGPARKSASRPAPTPPVMPPEPPPEGEEAPPTGRGEMIQAVAESQPADVRAEPPAPGPAVEDTGELASEGERNFLLKKIKQKNVDGAQMALRCGFTTLDATTMSNLTKVQFARLNLEVAKNA